MGSVYAKDNNGFWLWRHGQYGAGKCYDLHRDGKATVKWSAKQPDMGIVPRFKKTDVLTELEKGKVRIERGLLNTLMLVGEEFVKDARDNMDINPSAFPKGNYQDHTANLRSSIGYFVLNNGKIVADNFMGTAEGEAAGRQVLNTVEGKESGYMLVGVAGMDYAGYVESRGYNVITSQADAVFVKLPGRLQSMVARANKLGIDMGFDMKDMVITGTRSTIVE